MARPKGDRKGIPHILLLESPLDRNMHHFRRRSQGEAMAQIMRAWRCEELFKCQNGVINAATLRGHLRDRSTLKQVGLVHLVGHGEAKGKPRFLFVPNASHSDQWLDLSRPEGRAIFKPLKGRVLILSCCDLGKEAADSAMTQLVREAKLNGIIAYRRAIEDDQATFVDSLFYYAWVRWDRLRLEKPPWEDPTVLAERVKWALLTYGLHTDKDPIFVIHVPSEPEGVETIL